MFPSLRLSALGARRSIGTLPAAVQARQIDLGQCAAAATR
jgi:hypothetical protein